MMDRSTCNLLQFDVIIDLKRERMVERKNRWGHGEERERHTFKQTIAVTRLFNHSI